MSTLVAAVRLLRPVNVFITAIGVVVGLVLSQDGFVVDHSTWLAASLAALSAMCVAAGGNAHNDVRDLEIDAVNRPYRPLPSGSISVRSARFLWGLLTISGVIAGAAVSWIHALLAFLAAVMLFVYNTKLKRTPLAGNITVAFVVALALIYGGLIGFSLRNAFVGAVFAFLTTFAREVVKDVEDMAGDRSAGFRTLPLVCGASVARNVATGTLLLTVVLTPIPFLVMDYGPLFLLLVLLADLVLLRCVWLGPETPRAASSASAWLKGGMLIGIAALLVG